MTHYLVQMSGMLQASSLMLEQGLQPARLLSELDLPPTLLLDPWRWIDRTQAFRLANALAECLHDPFVGLHTAELLRLEQYGPWGEHILHAPTLSRALTVVTRDVSEVITGLSIRLTLNGDDARLTFDYEGTLGEDPRPHVEANLLILKKVIRLVAQPVPIRVFLPHPRPPHCDELERLLGADLTFDAPHAQLVFDRSWLSARLPETQHPSNVVHDVMPPRSPRETPEAVMRVLRELIQLERPTAAAVAAMLDLNVRTMQRHLAAWGLTFEGLLDQLRQRQAIEYLNAGRHSITEIAFRLGYSDSAHFTRAFRRWTGIAPRRAAARPELVSHMAV